MPLLLALLACAARGPAPEPAAAVEEPSAASTAAAQPEGPFASELVIDGPLASRVSTTDADVVLFFGGEHKGSMETCGCPKRPRGSLARQVAYINASRAANPGVPDVVLHGGHWLEDAMGADGLLREDVPVMNRWMIAGLDAAGFDAVNVSFQDLPGMARLQTAPSWLVSANVVAVEEGRVAPAKSLLIERGDLTIGVTGISRLGMSFIATPGYRVEDPYAAGLTVLQELAETADVVVLLAYDDPQTAKALAEAVPDLDLVIDTGMHREYDPPFQIGQAWWVRSHFQTMRLGELRLSVEPSGLSGLHRMIDLDPQVPDAPALTELVDQSRGELELIQGRLYGAP